MYRLKIERIIWKIGSMTLWAKYYSEPIWDKIICRNPWLLKLKTEIILVRSIKNKWWSEITGRPCNIDESKEMRKESKEMRKRRILREIYTFKPRIPYFDECFNTIFNSLKSRILKNSYKILYWECTTVYKGSYKFSFGKYKFTISKQFILGIIRIILITYFHIKIACISLTACCIYISYHFIVICYILFKFFFWLSIWFCLNFYDLPFKSLFYELPSKCHYWFENLVFIIQCYLFLYFFIFYIYYHFFAKPWFEINKENINNIFRIFCLVLVLYLYFFYI